MNLVRSSVLKHPSGLEVKTPLLIPSFSSKGFVFPLKQKSEKAGHTFFQTKFKLPKEDNTTSGKISEVAKLIRNVSDTLTDSMLVTDKKQQFNGTCVYPPLAQFVSAGTFGPLAHPTKMATSLASTSVSPSRRALRQAGASCATPAPVRQD